MVYDYKKTRIKAQQKLTSEKNCYKIYDIRFPSKYKTDVKKNNTVYATLYTPKKKFKQTILLIHGTGAGKVQKFLFDIFCKALSKRGFEAVFITLPYNLQRTPPREKSGRTFDRLDAKQTLCFFEQAILDIRSLMDMLEQSQKRRFSIFGTSLGGIIALMSMALDKRIKKGVFLVTGGYYPKLLWGGVLRFFMKEDCPNSAECRRIHEGYRQYIKKIKKPKDLDKVAFKKECYLYDPLTFTNMMKERPVLMINGLFDFVIPKSAADELWNSLGKPRLIWLPAGHGTTSLFYPKILKETTAFLDK
ncbi:MAG: alpha/beta family hydrolase [archaeon]